MKTVAISAALAVALLAAPVTARPMTAHDLASLRRISNPVVSPDGRRVVWQQRETDWKANKGVNALWQLDLGNAAARPVKLAQGGSDPWFTGDGALWFLAGETVRRIAPGGGAAAPVTQFKVDGFLPNPAGDRLLVWKGARPDAGSLAAAPPPAAGGSARTYDRLFVRHWDAWADDGRNRLFVLPVAGGKAVGQGVPVSAPLIGDAPSKPMGGREELAWSADGRTVFFALREAGRIEALSTNLDIFSAPVDGSAPPTNLTADNDATDTLPAVSPDGRMLAYVAMARPGYEADRQVLMLRDLATGRVRALTSDWDRSIDSIAWAPDGRSLLVTALDDLDKPLFRVDAASGKVARLTPDGTVSAALPVPNGVVIARETILAPADLWRVPAAGGEGVRLTSVNADMLAGIDMPTADRFAFAGADGDRVSGWVVKPARLAPGAKVPVAYIIHGGPQGSIGNGWSYRWNPALFASAGYGAVTIDFHGSTGHGQAFTDAINQDWGGKPLEDLKLGLAAATARFGWLDGERACALGGSYGGYMVNWIAGKWPDRFDCLVSHAGVFDARAMAYETEELWFDEWEHGGKPYYEAAADYERWNPVHHVAKWKTPMLVIHGEKDFRIPYTQGLAAFTALQRREVPSRLVIYPDENHWILKPANSEQWYRETLGWMNRWTKP